jgi:hypothetical protein
VTRIQEVRPTDLIKHVINLIPGTILVVDRLKRYTRQEREFAAKVFPKIEEASILVQGLSL